VNEIFNSIKNGHIQKVYACPFFYSFKVRAPGKTWFLYIGKGRYAQSIFLSTKRIESQYRRKDSYLDKIKKEFLGGRISELKYIKSFFCLSIEKAEMNKTLLFTHRENLLYCGMVLPFKVDHVEGYFLYKKKPYKRVPRNDFILSDILEFENKLLPGAVTTVVTTQELDPSFLTKRFEESIIKKKKKKNNLKIERIKSDIERLEKFLDFKDHLSDHKQISEYLENNTFTFCGIKVKNMPKDYYKSRDILFKKIKNIQMAIDIQSKRLEDIFSDKISTTQGLNAYIFPVSKKIGEEGSNLKVFSETMINKVGIVTIGKSSSENDLLRNSWAKPNDYWFHLKDRSGAHLFLRLIDGVFLTPDILEKVCQIFREHLKKESIEINIIYTRVKYLRKVSGTQGKVIPKKEKSYRSVI
jgi:hypothetical protein